MGIFGSKEKKGSPEKRRDEPSHDPDISQADKAKLELRRVRSRMKKLQAKYEAETAKFTMRIKTEMRAGRKDRARMFLRLRKLRQTALSRTDDQIINLERQLASIREQEDNIEYVRSLETANSAMEELQKIMPIDYVEEVLERNQELQDINAEITDMIAGDGLCGGAVVDEDEVLEELAALEAEVSGTTAAVAPGLSTQDAMDLPVAPDGVIVGAATKEEVPAEEESSDGRVLVAA